MEPTQIVQKGSSNYLASFFSKVYGWMSVGLFVSFLISFAIYFTVDFNSSTQMGTLNLVMLISFIFQIILVFAISKQASKLNSMMAGVLFILFAALNGVTLGAFTIYYELGSIAIVFLVTLLTFGALSLIGGVVKKDLSGIGGLAIFGLIGIIIGSFVNLLIFFIAPQIAVGISWALTYIGVGIFMILIAYDTQKLKKIAIDAEMKGIPTNGIAVQGALTLYLDFINMFIRLLAIFGNRR